ncbi:MAG: LytTR family DNA-binding domain-containing protein [Agriterribacter sp.]
MLRAIIIEDEHNAASLLEGMLKDINPGIQVLEKCNDLPCGVKSIKRNKPDIVFLDIELPVYSGIQLLDFLNPEEIMFHLIFTTASNEHAVRAFEMSAVDYLMKPIREEKLAAAINKISQKQAITERETLPVLKENLGREQSSKIIVPVTNGFEILNLKDICYFKAEGSYTCIYFADNPPLLVSKNLKHFEFILANVNAFIRIHRSFIANMNFVRKFLKKDGGVLCLENKTELPVAEDKTGDVLKALHRL